jgi:L-2,4-diaminobutyrate decarboxylase
MSAPEDVYDPEAFRKQGHELVDHLADYLARALSGSLPVVAWEDPDPLARRWAVDIDRTPTTTARSFTEAILSDALHQHHPRCFGHQVSVPIPAAALNALLVSVVSNGMASYDSGPVSSAIERNVTRWLASRIGMPTGADGVLTSGGTLGTLTALLAARHMTAGYDPRVGNTKPMAVIASDQTHYCVTRAATVMGWGTEGVVTVPVDESYRMRAPAVADAIDRTESSGRLVVAVVATAGASPTGSYDPIAELATLCAERAIWLHVDGAHGASAAMSDKYAHLLDGVDRADSVVWDAHKLLGLPALTTAVLFRRGDTSFAPFAQEAEYLFAPDASPSRWYDFGARNMECTKRMMSVELYGALAQLGTGVLDDYVTGRFDLARRFAGALRRADDFELATEPSCNIVCFRYAPAGHAVSDASHDQIRERLVASGKFFLTRTALRGKTHLRVTLMNPRTTLDDLEALLEAIRAEL